MARLETITLVKMAKRRANSIDDNLYSKRQKLTGYRAANHEKKDIRTVEELKSSLIFNQDDGPEVSVQSKAPNQEGSS
jgi:hypothetical protein